jgi:predicted transport protein
MKDHKESNNTDFEKVNKNIEEEEKTRLGNIKYVVDQVNTTNEAMDKEYMAEIKKLQDVDTGFGKLIEVESSSGSNIPMNEVTDTSKIKLMKDVSVIGSMSIKDLEIAAYRSSNAKPSFKACGAEGTKCIQFPDRNGDTYLTAFNTSNSVVSGSLFKAQAGAEITDILKTNTINNLTTSSNLTISTGTSNNTITVGSNTDAGITLQSGGNIIKINGTDINITTGTAADTENTKLGKIKINGKSMDIVTVASNGVLPSTTRVLTLKA